MDNFTPDISEKLVQYLDGELTGTEKEKLEQQLATDTALQEALKSLQTTREAVRLYGLQQRVAGIHQQMMEENQKPVTQLQTSRKIIRFAVGIAASVLLLFAGFTAYNYFTLSSEKVFAANFQSYELVTHRDVTTEESSILKNYRERKFSEASSIVYDRPFTTEELFVRGMAFAELKNSDKAIASFQKVLVANKTAATPVYNDEAEYYLGLLYVYQKEYEKALGLFHTIKNTPGHLYRDRVSYTFIRKVKRLNNR